MTWTPSAVKVGKIRKRNPELLIIKNGNPPIRKRRFKPYPWEIKTPKKKAAPPLAGGPVEDFVDMAVYAPFPGVKLGKVRVPMRRRRRNSTTHPLTVRLKGRRKGVSWRKLKQRMGRKAGHVWAWAAKYHRGRRVKMAGRRRKASNHPLRKKIGGRKLTWRQVVSKYGVRGGIAKWRKAGGYHHARNKPRGRRRARR